MWPKDTPRPDNNPFKFIINKKDIPDFVNSLHELQETYLNAALEKSGYQEANEVLARIMDL